jgi:hypothetical protein
MFYFGNYDRLCGQVVIVPGYRSRGPGSTPGPLDFLRSSRFGVQLRSYLEEKVAAPVQKTENTTVEIRHADHVAHSLHNSWH